MQAGNGWVERGWGEVCKTIGKIAINLAQALLQGNGVRRQVKATGMIVTLLRQILKGRQRKARSIVRYCC